MPQPRRLKERRVGSSSVKGKPPPVSGWGPSLMPVCFSPRHRPGSRRSSSRTRGVGPDCHSSVTGRSEPTNAFAWKRKNVLSFSGLKTTASAGQRLSLGKFVRREHKNKKTRRQSSLASRRLCLDFFFLWSLQLPQVAELELRACGKIGFGFHFFARGSSGGKKQKKGWRRLAAARAAKKI